MKTVSAPTEVSVTLVGHPFASVGMGEQLRSYMSACQSIHLPHRTMDIFRHAPRVDPDHIKLIGSSEVEAPAAGIRIFHVNADEIDRVQLEFDNRKAKFSDGYNIIVPAWELPTYPKVWAKKLSQFNEVWALSKYIAAGLAAVNIKTTYIGQSVESSPGYFLPRKYFGIRESAFTVLHMFDLTSYATRKNPDAVLKMFAALRQRERFRDVQLVLKVKQAEEHADQWLQSIRDVVPEALCITRPMSALETRSLINCNDCLASLHRAEGFGRGTAEAMFLGRLAMATGYSGNMDYMTRDNSLLVDYELVDVGKDEYPFGKGQVWAQANVGLATEMLDAVAADPVRARSIAARGQREVRLGYSHRAVGLRILDRVAAIREQFFGSRPAGRPSVKGKRAIG
jgi:hypothetical protein